MISVPKPSPGVAGGGPAIQDAGGAGTHYGILWTDHYLQHDGPSGDGRNHRERGMPGEHPPLGHYPVGSPVYMGSVPGDDPDRILPLFQTLNCDRRRAHPHDQLRGTALQQYWYRIPENLHRYLHGGMCYCSGLGDLLGIRYHTAHHCGQHPGSGHYRLELHERSDF